MNTNAKDVVSSTGVGVYHKFMKYPVLSAEEERSLLVQVKSGNSEQARNKLFEHNIRLAVACALKYKNSCRDIADLVQDAVVGLAEAIDKFDVTLGNRFSTYAWWYVMQHIRNQYAFQAVKNTTSLNATIDEDGTEVGELIADNNVASVDAGLNALNVADAIVNAMASSLTGREAVVVALHMGLVPRFSNVKFIMPDAPIVEEHAPAKQKTSNRGRSVKVVNSIDDLIAKAKEGMPITLEEVSRLTANISLAMSAGNSSAQISSEAKKMTIMGIQKVEARAMAKLKSEFAKRGITSLSDAIGKDVA